MSDSNKARAVSEAMANKMDRMGNEVLAEFDGGMIVAFTCLVQFVDETGERKWTFFVADGQTVMTSAGHLAYMNKIVDGQMEEGLQ